MYFSAIERCPLQVGDGDPVLCLHGSLGTARQWQGLAEALRSRYRVLAADLLGYADGEEWVPGTPLQLDDEVQPLLAPLHGLRRRVHLVGHSYGGAVALHLALRQPELVASLTLFEPTAFGLLLAKEHVGAATQEIRGYADTVIMLAQQGALHAAGRCFVDYWTGRGSWDRFAPERQAFLSRKMPKVVAEWGAGFTERCSDAELGSLRIPVTLLCGMDSPAPARRVVELLDESLPRATAYYVPGVGHMGPFTHAEQFNRTLSGILASAARMHRMHEAA